MKRGKCSTVFLNFSGTTLLDTVLVSIYKINYIINIYIYMLLLPLSITILLLLVFLLSLLLLMLAPD